MFCAKRASLVAALMLFAPFAWAQSVTAPPSHVEHIPPGEELSADLSLQSLEQIALERNPTLVQAGAQVRISRGKAVQAGLHPNPEIGYVADQIGTAGTAGELHGMFFEQEIVTGRKLQLSRAKFMQEARQAELQVMAQQYRVLYSVRVAYYNALARQQRLKLRRQLQDNSNEASKTVQELVNVGQANRSDLLQAEVALERARANLQISESRYRSSWEELAAIIGMPEMPPFARLQSRTSRRPSRSRERSNRCGARTRRADSQPQPPRRNRLQL
jgi:outer membrane protein TolC